MATEITGFDGETEITGTKDAARPVSPQDEPIWQSLRKALSFVEQGRPKAARDHMAVAMNELCAVHSLNGGAWL